MKIKSGLIRAINTLFVNHIQTFSHQKERVFKQISGLEMKKLFLIAIKLYQKVFSPDHSFVFNSGTAMRCRFYPSCSQYTYEAIDRYGVGKGILKGFLRVLRCNPLSEGGVDLV